MNWKETSLQLYRFDAYLPYAWIFFLSFWKVYLHACHYLSKNIQTVSENAVFPHLIFRKFSFTTWPFNGIPKYTFMAFTEIYKATLPATCVVLKSAGKGALSREKTSCNGNLVLVSEKKKKKKERKKNWEVILKKMDKA